MDYTKINAEMVDRWIAEEWEWGKPITHDIYERAKNGIWDVKLTPVRFVPHEWFGSLKDKKILGLASGGAQQMPVFQALGVRCTVLDYSLQQLQSERDVSEREGYEIEIVHHDMTKDLPFDSETFDLIFHPVSNCYVERVEPIFQECFRVLKEGGILLSGLDNGVNYIVDQEEKSIVHSLPFNPLVHEEHRRFLEQEDAGMQFSHTLEEQIGGQLKAGFQLTDLLEDTNGEGRLHERNIPSFLMTRSIKPTRL